MSILSDINTTMTETDLFLINKQLIEYFKKLSELTEELNETKLELSKVKNELGDIREIHYNLERTCYKYYEKVDNLKEKIEQFESI